MSNIQKVRARYFGKDMHKKIIMTKEIYYGQFPFEQEIKMKTEDRVHNQTYRKYFW